MKERVEKFLNNRFKKLEKDLEDFPFPSDDHKELKRFQYKLGQHDLIVELFSVLSLKNTNRMGPNNE